MEISGGDEHLLVLQVALEPRGGFVLAALATRSAVEWGTDPSPPGKNLDAGLGSRAASAVGLG